MPRVLSLPWHESFYKCVSPFTTAPDSFILWGALSLIGATLKNNVWFERGIYTLYPNQFIVLVSPPGIGKGTVAELSTNMINETKPSKVVNIIPDRITPEAIIQSISDGWGTNVAFQNQQIVAGAKDHNCLILSNELTVLLSGSDWMPAFLDEAWSRTTYEHKTKTHGLITIDTMCCSLLAATVPDLIRNLHKEIHMSVTGGFTSRCLFIYEQKKSKELPWPESLKKNLIAKTMYDKLVIDLKDISALRGEFTATMDAKIVFENFIKESNAAADKDESEAIVHFRSRMEAHTLKLAMAFSASKGNSLIIDKIDMHNSIIELKKILKSMDKLFRGSGDNIDAENTIRVLEFVEKNEPCSKTEILKALNRHFGTETLDRITYVLETIGSVEKQEINKRTYFRIPKQVQQVVQNKNGHIKIGP